MQLKGIISQLKAKGIDYLGKRKDNQFLFSNDVTVIINPDNTLTILMNINHADVSNYLV